MTDFTSGEIKVEMYDPLAGCARCKLSFAIEL
jgi:hypothetical protein